MRRSAGSTAGPGDRSALRRRVVLINPNTNQETTSRMVAIAQDAAERFGQGKDLRVEGLTALKGVPLITDEEALRASADAVIELGDRLTAETAGVIVSAFGDPGLDRLRSRLACPVVGIAESSFREAAADGKRFAVVTTTPDLRTAITARVIAEGFGRQFAGIWLTPGDPEPLMADELALRRALASSIEAAVREDCVEAVIIGGGPLASAARHLASASPVPLIEPIPAAVRRLTQLVQPV